MKKLDERTNQNAVVLEMTEIPSSISLFEEDFISFKEIGSKDYPDE